MSLPSFLLHVLVLVFLTQEVHILHAHVYLYDTCDLVCLRDMEDAGVCRICSQKFVLKSVHDSFIPDHPCKTNHVVSN
jgi:hypothetical protein